MEKVAFTKEMSEELALSIVEFLKKWGLFEDVLILTGGKCYQDKDGALVVKNEPNPGSYTSGYSYGEEKDFSNPERLLDMTFEGPLQMLLHNREYEVEIKNLSMEAREIVVPLLSEFEDEETNLLSNFHDFISENVGFRENVEYFDENDLNEIIRIIDKMLVRSSKFDDETFYSDGEICGIIIGEFMDLLESYGLWYEMGFSWSLTTYRK